MDLIADMLLAAGAIGAAIYCFVLARRLSRFNDLEKGVGGAVAVLSAQVDDLNRTLLAAQKTAAASTSSLGGVTERAEKMARRLELHLASLHDLPDPSEKSAPAPIPADIAFAGRRGVSKDTGKLRPISGHSSAKQGRGATVKPQPTKAKTPISKPARAETKASRAPAKPDKRISQQSRGPKNEPVFPRHSETAAK